jgi:4,5:9,10-diseco-3-hydroxy-5,9,17-trioxoandrosta-1(10),2-diene-4-oate hydrolase
MLETVYQDSAVLPLAATTICYVRKGHGDPVLLLHGIPLSLLTWRHNIDYLARQSTVFAIDMKGYGMSGKPAGSYTPECHASVIGEFLDRLGVPKVSLVGSSYGCAVAIAFAHAQPERVDKLVLINSVGYPGGPHSLERLLRIRILVALLRTTLRSPMLGQRIFASSLRKSYTNPRLASKELVEAYFDLLRRDSGDATFLATLQQFHEAEVARKLALISQETLIIWGADDHVLPATNAQLIHRDIQSSRLEIIPGCGHLPHEEMPEVVNPLITQFLSTAKTGQAPAIPLSRSFCV